MTFYPACFYHDPDGYTVLFPDLYDLATEGETLEDAMDSAIDCLAGRVWLMQLRKEELPAPSDPGKIDPQKLAKEVFPEEEIHEAFVSLVSVDVEEYARIHFERSVKKTLTIPCWLNRLAEEQHINFSQVLQEALKQKCL